MSVAKVSKPKKGVDIEEGSHVGLFLGLVHLGVQKGEYEGLVSYKDQVLLMFELPDITLEDGRPINLTARVTHSLSKRATLLKVGKALNGGRDVKDGIDWEASIGKPVLLELKNNAKGTGVNIKGYMAVPDVMRKNLKPLINEPKLLLDVDAIGDKELEKLPEWVRKVINERVKEEGETDSSVDF
jgi:hypothetical protein